MRKVVTMAEKSINNRLIYHVVAITLIAIFLCGVGSVESQSECDADCLLSACSAKCTDPRDVAECTCFFRLFAQCECERVTSVDLISFTAVASADGSVTLSWETGMEIDNAGFDLYRTSTEGGPYVKITDALIPSQGTEVFGASYSFIDRPGDGSFYYILADVNIAGQSTLHGPVQVEVGMVQP